MCEEQSIYCDGMCDGGCGNGKFTRKMTIREWKTYRDNDEELHIIETTKKPQRNSHIPLFKK